MAISHEHKGTEIQSRPVIAHTHTHTHTFHISNTAAATDLHIDPPSRPPHYPTVLITSERLQKVGSNNKATYYI